MSIFKDTTFTVSQNHTLNDLKLELSLAVDENASWKSMFTFIHKGKILTDPEKTVAGKGF